MALQFVLFSCTGLGDHQNMRMGLFVFGLDEQCGRSILCLLQTDRDQDPNAQKCQVRGEAGESHDNYGSGLTYEGGKCLRREGDCFLRGH